MTVIEAPPRPRRTRPLRPIDHRSTWDLDAVPAVAPASAGPAERQDGRLPALDGMRGFAFLLVLGFHEGWLPGAFIAVDLFFMTSGYVITRLLLPGRRNGGLGTFWSRRVRRLLPALFALLAAAQLYVHEWAPASQVRLLNGQTRSALAYVTNWYAIVIHQGYWESGASKTPLLHLWSLAVEEQFYFLWPLAVMGGLWLARGHVRPWMYRVTAVLAAASFLATMVLYRLYGADRAYYGTDTRVGMILAGAALAFRHATRDESAPRPVQRRAWRWLSWAALAGCVATLTTTGSGYYTGGQLAVGLATLGLLVASVQPAASGTKRFLSSAPLVWIGLRSYGMYLWSLPIQLLLTHDRTGLSTPSLLLLKASLLVVAGQVSYHVLEMPIRRGALPGIRLGGVLVAGALTAALASLVLQPVAPAQFTTGALLTVSKSGHGSLRILVVGDSWARNVGAGLVMADAEHRDTVLNDGIASCGLTDLATKSGDTVHQVAPDCVGWEARWRREVASFQPDMTLLVTGRWDQAAADIDGAFTRPGSSAFSGMYGPKLDEAIQILSSSGAPVYVANVVDNPVPAERRWSDAMNLLLTSAVRRNPRARLLDVHGTLCPNGSCLGRMDGAPVYDDTRHLTPEWQSKLGRLLLDRFHREVSPARSAGEARRAAAAAVLPDPAVLLGAAPTAVDYPAPDDAVAALLPGIAPEDRALTALVGSVTARSGSGDDVTAIGLRFGDDATPDRMAVAVVAALARQGWQRVPLDRPNRALWMRGNDIRVLARSHGALTVVDAHAASTTATERAAALVALIPQLTAGGR